MTVTVTSKGQVTLPAEARRKLGIHAGTKLEFIIKDDKMMEVLIAGGSVRDVKGILPRPKRPLSLDEINASIKKGALR